MVRLGSFAAAADALGCTQSAVSQEIGEPGLPGAHVEGSDGGPKLPELAAVAHPAELDDDVGRDQSGVVPGADRGGAGVGGLAADGEPLPGDGLDTLDYADADAGLGQDRALLDVALEPPGATAHDWSTAACRAAGFEPEVRHVTTDLQIHLSFVAHGLAVALVPDLAGAATRDGIAVHPPSRSPGAGRVRRSARRGC